MDAVEDLVAAAARGDDQAWDLLVDRFSGLMWSIARAHRLSAAESADVIQTAWLRLVENFDRLRDPQHVGAWLATTTRRECLRVLRVGARTSPAGDQVFDRVDPSEPTPEDEALRRERDTLLWRAVDGLPDRCRILLRVLAAVPPPSYQEVSAALDMPIGSIGPTRARCLERLRNDLAAVGITSAARRSSP